MTINSSSKYYTISKVGFNSAYNSSSYINNKEDFKVYYNTLYYNNSNIL